MKVTIYNTGPDLPEIASGEQKVVDAEVGYALAEKWSGMVKVTPCEESPAEPTPAQDAPQPAKKPSRASRVVQAIKSAAKPAKKAKK